VNMPAPETYLVTVISTADPIKSYTDNSFADEHLFLIGR
jgi:hypothetical protein